MINSKKGWNIVNDATKSLKLRIAQSLIMLFTVMVIVLTFSTSNAFSSSGDELTADKALINHELEKSKIEEMKFALIAAAAAFGLGAIGAGIAISHVGAAAMGAVAEKPQLAGQALIFVALAEGIVVFGFITALMIIGKV